MALRTIFRIQIVLTATLVTAASKVRCALKSANACSWYATATIRTSLCRKKIDAPYRSGPPKSWIKVNNPEVSGSNASY